ncbi:MAG TPA: PRC-barrel domain-containing protein [Nitrososphaera sp.]
MAILIEKDTEVITSDGKKIGKVKRIENEDYFIVYKKGLLADEEIRVPVSAILTRKDGSVNSEPIRLNMSEETLKHGYEFVQGEPNSEFMHGIKESEPKFKLEKQIIHFEPVEPAEEPNNRGISSPPVTKQHQAVLKTGEESTTDTLYSCDMCPAKFDKSEELQKHRSESHKGPVNI